MAVKIRLQRAGTRHRPFYRIVVVDGRSPRDGRFITTLGYYDPLPKTPMVQIDTEKAKSWIEKGAIASNTVKSLLKKAETFPTADAVADEARERRRSAVEEAANIVTQSPRTDSKPKADKPAADGKPGADRKHPPEKKPEAAPPKKPEAPKAEAKPAAPATPEAPAAETKPAAPEEKKGDV